MTAVITLNVNYIPWPDSTTADPFRCSGNCMTCSWSKRAYINGQFVTLSCTRPVEVSPGLWRMSDEELHHE